MIRFVNVGTQLHLDYDDPAQFAFYCTVKGEFKTFSGSQVWSDTQEFIDDFDSFSEEVTRYLDLVPEGWNQPEQVQKPKTTQAFEELCSIELNPKTDKYHFYYAGKEQYSSKSKFDCLIEKKKLQKELDV